MSKKNTKRPTKKTYEKRPDVAGVVAVLNEERELLYMMPKETYRNEKGPAKETYKETYKSDIQKKS